MPTGVYPRSEKLRRQISEKMKGRKLPIEVRIKLSGRTPWIKGRKMSKEHCQMLSLIHKGQPSSFKGHRHTDEAKKKISLAKSGKKLSIEHRIKLSISHRGQKSYLWRGGNKRINNGIRNRIEYRLWREAIFKRDNWTCQFCRIRSGEGTKVYLQADHIRPFALYPELRFELSNGRTLCLNCHKKTDSYMNARKVQQIELL